MPVALNFIAGATFSFGAYYALSQYMLNRSNAISSDLQRLSIQMKTASSGDQSTLVFPEHVTFGQQLKSEWNKQLERSLNKLYTTDYPKVAQQVQAEFVEMGKRIRQKLE